jgi:hypothetical protein
VISRWLDKFVGPKWFTRGLSIAVLVYTFRLTNWGASYATMAIMQGEKDLMGVAAIIGAVAAIPLGLITLVLKIYSEKANDSTI